MGALTQTARRVQAPGARGAVLDGTKMPLEAPKNAATSRLGRTLSQAAELQNTRAIQFQQEQNAVDVSKKIAELDQIKRDRVDPLLQLEGDQALTREGFERGIIDEADQIYDEAYDEIKKTLKNDDQIARFEVRFDGRRTEGLNAVVGHYAKQHQIVKKTAFEAMHSQAVTAIRTNVGDTAFFEDKLSQVKDDYNELHPGTNNGAVLDKIEQDMRVEYLKELMVVAPKLVDMQLEKWKDRIPASVADTIKKSARTEDEKQESNKLAAGALQMQAVTGDPKEAVAWIRKHASTPEIGQKANALFSAQVSLERRLQKEAEQDFADNKNSEFMGLWVNDPSKLTPDVISNSGLKADQQSWWLSKVAAGDSPTTSKALLGELYARAYEAPGSDPITSFEDVAAYTMPDPGRPGKTLSMKDAMAVWKLHLYNQRQERMGMEKTAEQLFKYDRSKSTGQGIALLKTFADQRKGGLSPENINETTAALQTWVSQNPEATGVQIMDKAKELGGDAILDRHFWEEWGGKPDIYPKDVLGADVGRPGSEIPYGEIVSGYDPTVVEKLDLLAEDLIRREPAAADVDRDQLRYRIYEKVGGPEGVLNYKLEE